MRLHVCTEQAAHVAIPAAALRAQHYHSADDGLPVDDDEDDDADSDGDDDDDDDDDEVHGADLDDIVDESTEDLG